MSHLFRVKRALQNKAVYETFEESKARAIAVAKERRYSIAVFQFDGKWIVDIPGERDYDNPNLGPDDEFGNGVFDDADIPLASDEYDFESKCEPDSGFNEDEEHNYYTDESAQEIARWEYIWEEYDKDN